MFRRQLLIISLLVVSVTSFGTQLAHAQQTSTDQRARPSVIVDEGNERATEVADTFPRLDGIYRAGRQTTLIGFANTEVFDYLVFSRDGNAYVITGDYVPGRHYLEQPDKGGTFVMRTVPVADQSEFILKKWIGQANEAQPVHALYEVKDNVVRFQIRKHDNFSGKIIDVVYEGERTENGMNISYHALVPQAATFRSKYVFVPISTTEHAEDGDVRETKEEQPVNPAPAKAETQGTSSAEEQSKAQLDQMSRDEIQMLAEGGHAEAQHRLAMMLLEDVKDPMSRTEMAPVIRWLNSSAAGGYEPAMLGLGTVYQLGIGVEQDLRRAELWYRAAIIGGSGTAEAHLGLLKLKQEEYQAAAKWFSVAARKGNATAQFQLGRLLLQGNVSADDFNPAEDYFVSAAEQGCDDSMAALGDMHISGQAKSSDRNTGISWYRKAAAKGNAHAHYNLGVLAYQENDMTSAAKHFQDAAAKGHVDATLNYGVMLFHIGDYDGSEKWLLKAAELGSRDAIERLHTVRRQRALVDQ